MAEQYSTSPRGQLNLLNPTQVKGAKPETKDYRLNDGGGLYLLVKANGSKLWRCKYTWAGKERLASFGKYPTVTLKKARDKRLELSQDIDDGIDPAEKKRQEKEARQNTFKALAEEWLERMKGQWTDRHRNVVKRSLKNDVYPALGSKPVRTITAKQILDTAASIADERGAHDVARRVLRRISSVMEYAAVTGAIDVNPAIGLAKFMPENKASRKRFPAISWKALPEFLQALDEADMFQQTRLGLRLLLLTAVRPGELRFAKWEEFDFERKVWEIPAERMKMSQPHNVPLSEQAIEVLGQLKAYAGNSAYVLPGRSTLMKPISDNALLYAIYRMGYKDQMSAHGCRAVFSSWANETGEYVLNGQPRPFSADAIERQLAHGEPNKVRDAYLRSDFAGERTEMMQVWADFLDRCSDTSGKVIDLKAKRQ